MRDDAGSRAFCVTLSRLPCHLRVSSGRARRRAGTGRCCGRTDGTLPYGFSRKVLTRARPAHHDVPMSPSQPLLVRRRHVDFRRVASAVCRPV
ncbi:putative leader peptide [Streptomyces sp. NPDC002104]